MTTEHDSRTRIVLSWLHEDAHENAERYLLRALDEVDTTPQRRLWWPAGRTNRMNSYAKLIAAGAGVLVVAIVGYQLLTPSATPSGPAASTAPSATTTSSPSPSPSPDVGAVCTPAPLKFDPNAIDLTGAWAGDDDGVYYVRQLDKVVWWNGMSDRESPPEALGRVWNNVGRGEIKDDLSIVADWSDVPRGGADGGGTVTFQIGPDSAGNIQITTTSQTGSGRGDTLWVRCAPGFPPFPAG